MRRRILSWLLVFATALAGAVGARMLTDVPITPTPYFDVPRPMVIAHQGGDHLRPGNTLAAFEHAAALGAHVLEMDVHATRDAVLVVMHDSAVDRTTDGHGLIREMSYAQVRTLDAGFNWPYKGVDRPYRGKGIRVPALREVLTAFPDRRFNIEIKQAEPPIAAELCALLRELGVGNKTLVASFSAEALRLFRRHCPEVASSLYQAEVGWFLVHQTLGLSRAYHSVAQAMQLPKTSFGISLVSPRLFDAARELGMHVDIWTVNDEQDMRTLIRNNVGGIITDRPDLLLDILRRRNTQLGTS